MYICEECGQLFESLPTCENAHYTMGGEFLGREELTETDCPNCRGEIVEAKECPFCGQTYISENEEFCDDCFDEWATRENAFEMGGEDTTEIEINGFLASVFNETEVFDILVKVFDEMPDEIKRKHILNYCGEDKYLFKEWLEEKFRNVDLHKWQNHE
jgi:RecJ-like exonuclease